MNLPSLNAREKRLAALTLAVAFLLANHLLVLPWWRANRERARDLGRLRAETRLRSETISRLPVLRREWEAMAPVVPQAGSREMWMKRFESLAAGAGVELLQRGAAASDANGSGEPTRVDCSMQGSFEGIVRFLDALGRDESHPQIESCHLSPVKAGEDRLRGQLALSVTLDGGDHP